VDEHRDVGEGALHRVELSHVVVVMVGEEHVGQRQLTALEEVQQRSHGTAGVDHDGAASQLVAHDVGVRQPSVAHRALNDHA
jgi:hypothetical protein